MAHALTSDARYARRAEKELLAASEFRDWNPSHFLDVAEMTAALGIGYDWLYNSLPEKSRSTIRSAIVDKGLKPSIPGGWWTTTYNNWNQVCNGGLAIGAIAVMDQEPELAATIIERTVRNLPHAMKEYAPDGAYPEGPSYWRYGTTYNVLILAALESAFGTDFKLSKTDGFLECSDYFIQSLGPSGLHFNYSDGRPGARFSPTLRWFSRKRNRPHLLRTDTVMLRDYLAIAESDSINYSLPLLLLWSPKKTENTATPATHWNGRGKTPVSFHRSSWSDPDATFFGIKGGSPSTNHGHMDIGSFVLDMLGERWAHDLGLQSYHDLESKRHQPLASHAGLSALDSFPLEQLLAQHARRKREDAAGGRICSHNLVFRRRQIAAYHRRHDSGIQRTIGASPSGHDPASGQICAGSRRDGSPQGIHHRSLGNGDRCRGRA